ncbi:sentrin-specific protease 1-like isoform X2 [Myzus persicae]|uniref:sentrin-specific protease 1-like isoform X2 n=1 Tax=Myzus persicae TaxID=13164 RepID=UPI000B934C33|nr:sentrin-specific protease 1-like isoform X2 [Myzus persicae]
MAVENRDMDPKAPNDEPEKKITKNCLTDTIVNKYLDLVTKMSPKTLYVFNTHFFTTFFEKGYLRTHWLTKNIDIFSKERLFIPIHMKPNKKWALVYVNFIDKSIRFYDAFGTHGLNYQKLVLKYLRLEHLMRKGKCFSIKDWRYFNLDHSNTDYKVWDTGLFLCVAVQHFAQNGNTDYTLSTLTNKLMNFSSDVDGCEKKILEKILFQIKRNSIH